MIASYEAWLQKKGCGDRTISTTISELRRVQEHYGNLDQHFRRDRLESVLQILRYSTNDERHGKSNPTSIPIAGILRTNLASYRSAVSRYREFLDSEGAVEVSDSSVGRQRPRYAHLKAVTEKPRTLADFAFNGLACLQAIIESSQYLTTAQAIASLTLFTHPDTVSQTGGQPVFFAVRDPRRVGEIAEIGGRKVALDDNKSPTDAFLWSNQIARRGRDTQINHVYSLSSSMEAYTALPNICMTPAFISKLTDTNNEIKELLKFRVFDLYRWFPSTQQAPIRPDNYDSLEWAAPLDPVADVRRVIEKAMARKPKSRTVTAARELGWLFDQRQPNL